MVFDWNFRLLLLAALLLPVLGTPLLARDRLAAATIVIYNSKDPDSAELARYYAERRDIPPERLIGLACPQSEEISRTDFEETIAKPLREKLVANGWWQTVRTPANPSTVVQSSIRFVALIRGIPLKIARDASIPPPADTRGIPQVISSRNDASVDSEIAALGLSEWEPASIVENPYFGRFTQILDDSVFPGMLLPARLDAPTAQMVRRMIDDSLRAEKDGLWGWAYIDGRNITSGGYAEGDTWMRHLVAMLRQRGVPTIFDNLPTTFNEAFPITDAAVYFGWYAGDICGPFAAPDFHFKPGAVAVHLHSFSAATLRSTTRQWCGPLIAHGAAATLGNVYEPYLALTANLDIFQDRLMSGLTLAESAYMSMRALSWMGVVVGDPLYRPYSVWNQFYDPRNRPPNPWRKFRSITLAAKGDILNASIPLRDAAHESGDSMFLEALGNAQSDAGDFLAAEKTFREALALASTPEITRRLEIEAASAKRGITPPPEKTPEPTGPAMTPPDYTMPNRQDGGSEAPLLKPSPPSLHEEIPNLPYPDQ